MIKTFGIVFMIFFAATLSACSLYLGDVSSARKAVELATDCQTDEALKIVEKTEKGGGIAAVMADFEREAILRDAGQIERAEMVKAARDQRTDIDEETKASSEKTVLDLVESIRKNREEKTGSRTCQ